MAEIKKIEERTLQFIEAHALLKGANKMVTHEDLAKIIGAESKSTISEILSKRQNIQPEQWNLFKKHFKISTEYSVQSGSKSGIVNEDPVQYNKITNYGDPAYLAGQLAMAERLIAKLESDHAEAKADKEKLFSVLAAAQNTINEVLKPIKEKTEIIETNSITIRDHLAQVGRMVRADDQAMMEGTDKILGRESGTTSQEASIVEHAFGNQGRGDGTSDKTSKKGKAGKEK